MNTLQSIWNGLDWSYLLNIVLSVVPSLLCITFHEMSHGWVAYRLGDTTAKDAGRLTLNPLKHIDPMGLLMMVVFKFGWAKPVPVNMMRFRNPKRGMALTALAGPVSNVLLALVFLFLYGLLYRALPNRVRVAAFFIASLLVPAGYFLYETILYGAVCSRLASKYARLESAAASPGWMSSARSFIAAASCVRPMRS